MIVALTEYSIHRNRLMPRRRSDSYALRATVAVARWSAAARNRNTAIATAIDTSNTCDGAGGAAPGGPWGYVEVMAIANPLPSTRTATAWTACNAVRPRFQRRSPASA